LHIPSLETLADSTFLGAHCFVDIGRERIGRETLWRVDFRADDRLNVPDVNGSMYLDTATYQVRREVFRLSRAPRQLPWVEGVEVTTSFDEIYPSILAISDISSHTSFAPQGVNTRARAEITTQHRFAMRLVSSTENAAFADAHALNAASAARARPVHWLTIEARDSLDNSLLAGAEVFDSTSAQATVLDSTGRARFRMTPGSTSSLVIRRIGYGMKLVSVEVPADVTSDFTVVVPMPQIVRLSTVMVRDSLRRYMSGRLNAFLERLQNSPTGYFVGDSALRLAEGRRLGDVLRTHAPGVILAEGSHGATYLFQSPRCAAGGPPQVYLDGIPLSAPQQQQSKDRPIGKRDQLAAIPSFDLTQFQISDLAGVEYYPDNESAPIEFAHTSQRCGALLLWTRER
jgi:hypothetical protein